MTPKNKTENPVRPACTDRPPVVVIMGHIDHGKSTLLDYIRKTNVTAGEAGGITQHISAYEAECEIDGSKRKITFLDTPGHEAFCSVRERGAKIADIAVLVISAEDGVKPQTTEIIKCVTEDKMPFIIALNKIDRPGANVDKVKQDLAEHEVLVEGWGGSVPVANISAKTGQGVPELLELIALQADIEELKGDPTLPAEGFVVESNLNPKQGISATLIIKDGSLETSTFVATEGAYAPVRAIGNYKGENIKKASFSSPIMIVGWSAQPKVGDIFKTFYKKDDAIEFASKKSEQKHTDNVCLPTSGASFDVVVKTDTFGSLDAIEHELKKLNNDKISVRIISKDIGTITETDIKSAKIKKSLVLGFQVGTDKSAEALAMRDGIEIKTYRIIYDLIDYVKERLKEATPEETVEVETGSAKILKTFSQSKDKQVVGGRMNEGEIKIGSSVKIYRREALIGTGKIKEMQVQKIKTDSAKEGQEFGMMIESKTEVAGGDILKATVMIKQ